MKFAMLKSAGHNVSDSLASGIGLMIGVYDINIFAEAASTRRGHIEVDFLRGTATLGASRKLRGAVRLYSKALPKFFVRHGVNPREVVTLSAKFGVHPVYGRHFTVTVENSAGKRSVDQYVGVPGRKLRRGEKLDSPEKHK